MSNMKLNFNAYRKGFTLVEIIVVVGIIGILATITIIGYKVTQDKAADAVRLQDATTIVKALQTYNADYNNFPARQTASGVWETSYDYPVTFINPLVTSGILKSVPVDRINTATGGFYRYYTYPSGYMGCPASSGNYYVFEILRPGGGKSSQSPGFKCSGRDWSNEAWYVTGGYTNSD